MKVYTAFRHVGAVGWLAERTTDKTAQKSYRNMIFEVAKKASKSAPKGNK